MSIIERSQTTHQSECTKVVQNQFEFKNCGQTAVQLHQISYKCNFKKSSSSMAKLNLNVHTHSGEKSRLHKDMQILARENIHLL